MSDKQPDVPTDWELRHHLDRQHIKLSYIIHFFFDQADTGTLDQLLDLYRSYNQRLLEQIEFILIDDCSSLPVSLDLSGLNAIHLKITDDIPWNQPGARNLGATYAAGPNLILSDIDIEFPETTLAYLVDFGSPKRSFYKFWRYDCESKLIHKPHSNVFFLSRATFFENFGYDEEYCGAHGGDDYRFVKFLKYQGVVQRKLPKKIYAFSRKAIDREKSYHSLERDHTRNTPIDARKRSENRYLGGTYGHSRIFLNFRWELVQRQFLRPKVNPPLRKIWQRLWLLRQLRTLISDLVRA